MILLFLSLPLAKAAEVCPRTFTAAELLVPAAVAERAFTSMDADTFEVGEAQMRARLSCVGEVLDPAALAKVHWVEALASFIGAREDRVGQALAGMFAADPGRQVPASALPEKHPIRERFSYAVSLMRDGVTTPLPTVASGWIEADGTLAKVAPSSRATLLQQLDAAGKVVATHYRWPDDTDTTWLVAPPVATAAAVASGVKPALPTPTASAEVKPALPAAPANVATKKPARVPLLAGVGASLVASGTMFALAAGSADTFADRPVLGGDATGDERSAYRGELESLQSRTNGLAVGGYAAIGLGVALGVVTVFTW